MHLPQPRREYTEAIDLLNKIIKDDGYTKEEVLVHLQVDLQDT